MAILAAYALVLQVVTAGLAIGVQAGGAAPLLDAFGGVICTADASGGQDAPAEVPQSHVDPSCLAACALTGKVLIGAPTAPGLVAPSQRYAAIAAFPSLDAPTLRPAVGPFGPRGPPAAT